MVICAPVAVGAVCLQDPFSEYEQLVFFPQLTLHRLLGLSPLLTASKMSGWGLSEEGKVIIQNSLFCLSPSLFTS